MSKVGDKFRDMKRHAAVNARDLAGASVIQQTGLDTPEGMQRMLSIMLHKFDPESKGVIIGLKDLQAYGTVALAGRKNILVYGLNDSILFKLCTDEEMARTEAHAREIFDAQGKQQ